MRTIIQGSSVRLVYSLFADAQRPLYPLVDDVTDADGRQDLEEVWCNAPVESANTLLLPDVGGQRDETS